MAENKPNVVENLQENLGKVEQWIENNKKPVLMGGGVLLALGVVLLYVFQYYLPDQNVKAQKAMYMAEFAFAKDSFALALKGRSLGGQTPFKGFEEISNEYSLTKSGKLSAFYAGICCLQLKKFDDAKKFFDKCGPDDPILGAVHLSALGDAYTESGDFDKGITYYEKAANYSDNESYTPYFLFKTGMAYEYKKNLPEAKKCYEKIRDKYPNSDEGRDIEKYIARVSAP